MKNSFLTFLYIIIAFFSLFTWYSVAISPSVHWVFVFIPLAIPVLILLNILFLILWMMRGKWLLFAISIVVLVLGYDFLTRTISLSFSRNDSERSNLITVLSYNVRVFNAYAHLSKQGKASESIIEFAADFDTDIKCFQEFYNYPEVDSLSTVKVIKKRLPFYYFKPVQSVKGQDFGLAIFSKYPIVKKGVVPFPHRTLNQVIFADIVVKKDTVRVFNMHLQSMSIDESKLPELSDDREESKSRLLYLIRKLKRGAEFRTLQIEALLAEINKSPYKVILMGDLNDTPYSYAYEMLREKLKNAFEEKGSGFGFTYNGKLFFLRIDNIFYNKKINLSYFKVLDNINHSDHFPLVAGFNLSGEE